MLQRRLTSLIVSTLLVCAAWTSVATASGRSVLDDYDDDGQIQRCYSDAEFTDALNLADTNREVYGAAIDIIEQRRLECAQTTTAPTSTTTEDGGNPALWATIGLIGVAAIGAIGYLAWARRQRSDDDTPA